MLEVAGGHPLHLQLIWFENYKKELPPLMRNGAALFLHLFRTFAARSGKAAQRAYLLCPERFVRRLQNDGHVVKATVLHQPLEEGDVYQSLPNAVVPVHAAGQCLLRVVQVDGTQVAEAYGLFKFLEYLVILFHQIVSGGEGVAGVQTDTYARLVVHAVDDVAQLLELVAHVAPLAGRVFDDSCHARCPCQYQVNRLRHSVQTLFQRNLVQVAAGMKVQQLQSQLFAALHLVQKGCTAFGQPLLLGMSQIDEVAVVWQDVACIQFVLLAVLLEEANAAFSQRFRHPLTLVLGEQGKSVCTDFMCMDGGGFYTAAGRYMCSDILHT